MRKGNEEEAIESFQEAWVKKGWQNGWPKFQGEASFGNLDDAES